MDKSELVEKIATGLKSKAKVRRLTATQIDRVAGIAEVLINSGCEFVLKADAGAVCNSYDYQAQADTVEIMRDSNGVVTVIARRGSARKVATGDYGRIYLVLVGELPSELAGVVARKRGHEYWF